MNKPLISVIIPVYNVEKYLNRCVNSVINQTYKNLEIILVDDGSLDNSGKMCDELVSYDNRIKVIHQANKGLSGARNTGLACSHGDFIAFVDSDDWIKNDYYEYCLNLIKENDADIVQINFENTNGETIEHGLIPEIKVLDGKKILQYYLYSTTIKSGGYSVCRCVFKKKLLENLIFREGKINEDIDFKYKAFAIANKLVVSNQIKYFYFQDSTSISRGGLKRKDFDLRDAAEELWQLAKDEDYGSIRFLAKVKKARSAFSFLCKIAYYGIDDSTIDEKQIIKELTAEHRKNLRILLKAPLPVSRKILAIGFFINFKLTYALILIYKQLTLFWGSK